MVIPDPSFYFYPSRILDPTATKEEGENCFTFFCSLKAVFRIRIRIRIHRIHMFLGLPDPDPLVRGKDPAQDPDPDPYIIMQK